MLEIFRCIFKFWFLRVPLWEPVQYVSNFGFPIHFTILLIYINNMNFKMRKNKWSSPDCFLDFTMICFSKRIPGYISFFLFLLHSNILAWLYLLFFSLCDKSKLCDLCKSFISFILYTFMDIKNFLLFFFGIYRVYTCIFKNLFYFYLIWFFNFFFWRGVGGGGTNELRLMNLWLAPM